MHTKSVVAFFLFLYKKEKFEITNKQRGNISRETQTVVPFFNHQEVNYSPQSEIYFENCIWKKYPLRGYFLGALVLRAAWAK